MSTASRAGSLMLVERMGLKTLVESCLVLEEGVASAKDIEIGMMMGAGILPGPFTRADDAGLDTMLEQLERAHANWGESYEPNPSCGAWCSGSPGQKSGQGFFAYPQPDDGIARPVCSRRATTCDRGLNRPTANPFLSGIRISSPCWRSRRSVRALVRPVEHLHLLRRRGHQGVHKDDP